ncbi:hypothetical protein R1flu_007113 [Riccia fluitans]|uniref:Uncharacterized protein n=1 Tax=Riccia fluitans TaxID=41844 RepID=A0ABD1Z0L3_9MARC
MSMATVLQIPILPRASRRLLQMKLTRNWKISHHSKTLVGQFRSSPLSLHFCRSRKKKVLHIGIVARCSAEEGSEKEHSQMLAVDSDGNSSRSVESVRLRGIEKKSPLGRLMGNLQLFGVLVALGMVFCVRMVSATVEVKKKEFPLCTRPVSSSAVMAKDRLDEKGRELAAVDTTEAEEAGYHRKMENSAFLGSEVDGEDGKTLRNWIQRDGTVVSGFALAAEIDRSDEEAGREYEEWKDTPYAITVPLRLVGLRGSVPPVWLKDFTSSQGKRVKLVAEFQGSLQTIFTELSTALTKQQLTPKSALAADLVTIGDSWLGKAVSGGLINPIENVEKYEWFQRLGKKWQVFLRRNQSGDIDADGKVYAVPYRWGSVVIAYNKKKFKQNGIPAIEDWEDLWRPALAGRISMISSPRDVIGAVLKSLGASYNVRDFETDVQGGRQIVREKFYKLQQQVRLFDSVQYLKTLGAGEVWVAVGWSGDVIPFAKRTSNISVVTPRSGTSLWADLWAIPATPPSSSKVGGRIRGPSPLVSQWLDFCLQSARANSFTGDVIVGASPLALAEMSAVENSTVGSASSAESLDTEASGLEDENSEEEKPEFVPKELPISSHDVLGKNEFLEPLCTAAVEDFKWLLSTSSELPRTNPLAKGFQNISSSGKAAPS